MSTATRGIVPGSGDREFPCMAYCHLPVQRPVLDRLPHWRQCFRTSREPIWALACTTAFPPNRSHCSSRAASTRFPMAALGTPKHLKHLDDHVRARRIDLGLRQRDVADRRRAEKDTVRNWEVGRTAPGLRFLPPIISFLGYNPLQEAKTRGTGQTSEAPPRMVKARVGSSGQLHTVKRLFHAATGSREDGPLRDAHHRPLPAPPFLEKLWVRAARITPGEGTPSARQALPSAVRDAPVTSRPATRIVGDPYPRTRSGAAASC